MMAWGGGRRHQQQQQRGRLRALRAMAVASTLLGGFVLLLAHTVQATMAEPAFYESALVRADAYDRIYRDVLVDPMVTGRLQPIVADLPSAGPVISDNLRTVVPPATLRQMVEPIVRELVRYVRGELAGPTVAIELQPIVDAVHAVAEQYLPADAGQVWSVLSATGQEFRPLLEQVLGHAVRGDLQGDLQGELTGAPLDLTNQPPLIGGLADLAVAFVPPDQRVRLRPLVEDRLLAGDVGGALELVLPAAHDAAEQAMADAAPHQLDGAPEVRVPADQLRSGSLGQFLVRLRRIVRTTAAAQHPLLALIALSGAVALAATAALRRDPLRLAGLVLSAVGALWLLVVASLRAFVPPSGRRLDGALTDLPLSVRRLMNDVAAQLLSAITRQLAQTAQACLLAGLVVTALAVVLPMARRWARTPWRVVAPTGALALVSLGLVHVPLWPWQAAAGEHRCNGSVELCNRRYDQVVQAASHNAMAAADYRFFAPAQDLSITEQLDVGVRALLIDTHYWEPPSVVEEFVSGLPEPIAARTRSLLGSRLMPRTGTWLCHRLCALGAIDLVTALREVAKFLDSHPDEVVTLDVEDGIFAADTEAALRSAGLFDRLFTPPPPESGATWPTLGDMIASRRNLVVFAESTRDSSRPWYPSFFDYVMDTPYNAPSRGDLTCDVNRGGSSRSMFLLNHWVSSDAASRDDASVVNDANVIVERARRCAAERGVRVTMVAVDFADIGDVVGAVDRLNRDPALQGCGPQIAGCPRLGELAAPVPVRAALQPLRTGRAALRP
jgi:hypothetical protein